MSAHTAKEASSKDDKPSASSTTSKKRSRAAEDGDDSKLEPRRSARTAGGAAKETSIQPAKKKKSNDPVSAKQSKTKSKAKGADGKAEDGADDAGDDKEDDGKPPPGKRASDFEEVQSWLAQLPPASCSKLSLYDDRTNMANRLTRIACRRRVRLCFGVLWWVHIFIDQPGAVGLQGYPLSCSLAL